LTTAVLIVVSWTPTQPEIPNTLVSPTPEPDPGLSLPDDPVVPQLPPGGGIKNLPIKSDHDPVVVETTLLRVESEPPRAKIHVEGDPTGQLTPASVTVPEGKNLVWIRVELEGYQPQERQIDVAVGAALFTLSSSSPGIE